jgi:glyoxylase-like metal-dependent hydrolase (beta-lactamase superfamily II)
MEELCLGWFQKTIWNRTNPADANNLIDMAVRCLLVEDGNRLTLIDTGMGDKQSEKFFGYYNLWGDETLDKSLKKYGFHRDDVTDIFMTHLHFDHCGGCIKWNKERTGYEPAFKNARFWSNKEHWLWATQPNAREKASFLKENIIPMEQSGRLHFLERKKDQMYVEDDHFGFGVFFADGHTDKQNDPPYKASG